MWALSRFKAATFLMACANISLLFLTYLLQKLILSLNIEEYELVSGMSLIKHTGSKRSQHSGHHALTAGRIKDTKNMESPDTKSCYII